MHCVQRTMSQIQHWGRGGGNNMIVGKVGPSAMCPKHCIGMKGEGGGAYLSDHEFCTCST